MAAGVASKQLGSRVSHLKSVDQARRKSTETRKLSAMCNDGMICGPAGESASCGDGLGPVQHSERV